MIERSLAKSPIMSARFLLNCTAWRTKPASSCFHLTLSPFVTPERLLSLSWPTASAKSARTYERIEARHAASSLPDMPARVCRD